MNTRCLPTMKMKQITAASAKHHPAASYVFRNRAGSRDSVVITRAHVLKVALEDSAYCV